VRLALAVLPVTDLDAAAVFYERACGFEVTVREAVYVEMHDDAGMRLGLYLAEAWSRLTGAPPAPIPKGHLAPVELYLYCEDLDVAIDRVVSAGARVLSDKSERAWGDECAYFADPMGNVLVLARPRLPTAR